MIRGLRDLLRMALWTTLSDKDFVEFAYLVILGRQADMEGAKHYLGKLANGEFTRKAVIEVLISSEEFKKLGTNVAFPPELLFGEKVTVCDAAQFVPYTQDPPFQEARLCELANPDKWKLPEWMSLLKELTVIPAELDQMHRKGYEWTQTAYGLGKLGALGNTRLLGVGTGHEPIIYWLANHASEVVATDLFDTANGWSRANAREGDARMLTEPELFAPFPYQQGNLIVRRMDGCQLEFEDNSFDGVFSLSSIEHFGGMAQAARAMREIGRVLKPGGVAAVATEMTLNGVAWPEVFTADELREYVVAPSGLKLIQLPVFEIPRHALERPLLMPKERYATPHLALRDGKTVYTSIMLFFRKPATL